MLLLLVRHGEAVDDAPGLGDSGRWLTGHGRKTTRSVAAYVKEHAPPGAIWTSALVRAVQTAEILAEAVGLEDDLEVVRDLANGDLHVVLKRAAAFRGRAPLALVGHEPMLSSLAVHLLGAGSPWPGFKKSGVCAIRWDGRSHGHFEWLLVPKGLRVFESLDDVM